MTPGEHEVDGSNAGLGRLAEGGIPSGEEFGRKAVEAVEFLVQAQKLSGERDSALTRLKKWQDEQKDTQDSKRRTQIQLMDLQVYKGETQGSFSQIEDREHYPLDYALLDLEQECRQILQDRSVKPEINGRARNDLALLGELTNPINKGGKHYDTKGSRPHRLVDLNEEQQALIRRALGVAQTKTEAFIKKYEGRLTESGDGVELREEVEKLTTQVNEARSQTVEAIGQLNEWEMALWEKEIGRPFGGTSADFIKLYELRFKLYWKPLQQAPKGRDIGQLIPHLETAEGGHISLHSEIERHRDLKEIYGMSKDFYLSQRVFLRPPEGYEILLVTPPDEPRAEVAFTLDYLATLHWPHSGEVYPH